MHSRTTLSWGLTVVTALAAVLTACELTRPVESAGTTVAQLVIVPATVTLDPSQTQQFRAYGRTQSGDSVGILTTWSATGGAIAFSGLYTAGPQEGDYQVTAFSPPLQGQPPQNHSATVRVRRGGLLVRAVVVPGSPSVVTGGTQQFAAYGLLNNGDSVAVSVTWSASAGTISPSGLYTAALAPGGDIVLATASGTSGAAIVAVTNVSVASVAVSPASATVSVGSTQPLSAVVKDAAGTVLTGRTVTWATSRSAVATVSSSGLMTGAAVGTATITATSEGQSGSATVTVANLPVASVAVSPAAPNIYVGGSVQLTATPKDANGSPLSGRTVTWTTSNSTVATVSASGLVTGLAVGSATMTATSEGQSGTAAVTVSTVPVASVVVSPAAANISVGGTAQLSATVKDAAGTVLAGRAATWTSSNPAIATVSAAGLVTGVAAGTATMTATSEGKSAAAAISVANVAVASVVISPVTAVVLVGATLQLTATLNDAAGNVLSGRPVIWASSAPAVATVSSTGLVTGVAASAVTITATSEGKAGSATVTVNLVPVASVSVSPASAGLPVGQTVQLSATPLDANGLPLSGRPITWASSAPAVAVVSSGGLVTGGASGSAIITATSEGKSGTAAITVTSAGRNYYVAPSGSDANPCSAAAPCYTMQRVSQLMSPGDIAHFASGNYTWNYSGNRVTKSGTAAALITYISDTKWGAKIYGSDCSPITNDGEYVQIINFDVTGSCVQGITTNGSYSRIIGNRVHDMPGTQATAAIVGSCCDYRKVGIQIIGNVVDNIGPWDQTNQTHGIYMASGYGVVANNIVTRAASACIQMYHGSTHEIIANNVLANCGRYSIQVSADPAVTTNDYTSIVNNIIVNGGHYGIKESSSVGSHNVYYNNIVYNNPDGNIAGGSGIQLGNITLTSAQFSGLFVNYTGDMRGDYHLRSGAVGIDAGTTRCAAGVSVCVPALDFDGLLRPRGTAYDIGAYEY